MKPNPHAKMSHGVGRNTNSFHVFNTISFSIALTTPMLLCFKGLGVFGTVLGIMTALPALPKNSF